MNRVHIWTAGACLAFMFVGAGCSRDTAKNESRKPDRPTAIKSVAKKPVTETSPVEPATPSATPAQVKQPPVEASKPQPQVIAPQSRPPGAGILAEDPLDSSEPSLPPVVLSDQHAGTCLIKVGDTMPEIALPDINGAMQDLQKLFGERLTIVLFWSPEKPSSIDELNELATQVASQLHPMGVRIYAICEHGTAQTAKQIAEDAGASFPVVIDEDGATMSHVATSKLPRTYLLDPTGKVLWFDIEYSHAMWRDLRQALRALIEAKPAENEPATQSPNG